MMTFDDLGALERLLTPLWVFDSRRERMTWGNRAALDLWCADNLEEFCARDFGDMSEATRTRLSAVLDELAAGRSVVEQWTLYPRGRPVTMRIQRSGIRQPDGTLAMLLEGQVLDQPVAPATLRGVEALNHTSVMITLFDPAGVPLMRNPAAQRAFGGSEGDDLEDHRLGSRFIHPADRDELLATLAAGAVYSRVVEVATRAGVRWHGLDARPAIDPVTGGPAILVNERDVTELKALEAQVRRERAFMRAVIDVTPNPVFVIDAEGRYVVSNEANAALLGRTIEEIEGQGLDCVVAPDLSERWAQSNRALLASGREDSTERRIRLPDGSERWLKVVRRPFAHGPDGAAMIIGSAVDITDLKEAKEKAEAADRAKSQFLANMSHELRTPLNSVLGFSEIIRDLTFGPDAAERYSEYAGYIHRSGSHLLDVVNDILDIAKLEAGIITIRPGPVDTGFVLTEMAQLVSQRVEERHQTLRLDLPDPPPRCMADERMLKQIVLNLLSNAVKFTPDGGAITVRSRLETGGTVAVAVADTGIGIPADQIARVRRPFEQVNNTYDTHSGGTGLGLALVDAMTSLHGGTLTIDSVLGHGTTVTVRLPAA